MRFQFISSYRSPTVICIIFALLGLVCTTYFNKKLTMSILSKFLCSILSILLSISVQAQSSKAPLSRVINVPSTIQIAPSLSGDGQHMIFTTTANLKSELLLHYATQTSSGKWSQPIPLDVINRSQNINHLGGYSLSYDGRYIFFTSRKTYGIGKYDIWYSEKVANTWSAPKNLAKPVNSPSDEGCPSLSADGQSLYFVRCNTMDQKDGEGCVLMVSKRRNSHQWGEPKALPDHINSGNILSPKILADNETLIFAKGQGDEIDLYQTRFTVNGWSKPIALDYVNTPNNERFASVAAQGDILYYSTVFQGTYDIIKAKIPKHMQPQKVVLLKGQVMQSKNQEPVKTFVQIYDLDNKELKQYYRTTDQNGVFEFYIPGGKRYDFSVVPIDQNLTFYSEIMDLRDLQRSSRQKLKVELEPIASTVNFRLNAISFATDSTLDDQASFEMSRLFKLLKSNPRTQIEIGVHRDAWETDSMTVEEELLTAPIALDSTNIMDSTMIALPPPPDPTEIRAQAIVKYLLSKGVPEHLVVAKGYADTQPIAPNDTEENRQLNRRVEIRIL